jgi:CheY-like chemotaxis protein
MSSSYRARKTVLIVDDNPDVREICSIALDYAGYHVLNARDGLEGVTMAREALPDMVVMDGKLPVMGGWDAARLLKADPRTAPIPVVAFTASAVTPSQLRMLQEVTDGYIPKPCYPSEFLDAVRRWIGPAEVPVPLD